MIQVGAPPPTSITWKANHLNPLADEVKSSRTALVPVPSDSLGPPRVWSLDGPLPVYLGEIGGRTCLVVGSRDLIGCLFGDAPLADGWYKFVVGTDLENSPLREGTDYVELYWNHPPFDPERSGWHNGAYHLSLEAAQCIARKYVSSDVGHKASALIDYLDDCQRRLVEFGIATVTAPPMVSAYPNEPGAAFNADGLIPVVMGEVGGRACPVVNARDLHEFMAVARDFSTWIKKRITDYGFIRDQDYREFSPDLGKTSNGGRPCTDYHLTLDMAKELAMVERNDKGKQIRRYFIECERQVLEGRMSSWAAPAVTRTASTPSDPEEADSVTPSPSSTRRKTTPGTPPSGSRPKPRGRK